jgi:Uncharacterized protein conserved in bacteria
MGTKLYIMGYGEAIAADVASAIQRKPDRPRVHDPPDSFSL